ADFLKKSWKFVKKYEKEINSIYRTHLFLTLNLGHHNSFKKSKISLGDTLLLDIYGTSCFNFTKTQT
ncbi:MAG: hypothetical protein Q8R18_06685, partial [bacterium]|nr:hypothetical protein [bacterium]